MPRGPWKCLGTATPRLIPVSTLARHTANPEAFTTSAGHHPAAMDRAAERRRLVPS